MDVLVTLKKYPGVSDVGNLKDVDFSFFLDIAKDLILKRRYRFGNVPDEFPEQYEMLQVRIAADMIFKLGAEGQLRHSEGDITREYAAGYVSPDLLREVIPFVGVPR